MKRRRPDEGPTLFDHLEPDAAKPVRSTPPPPPEPEDVPSGARIPELSPEQQRAVELQASRLIAASAGTGKTTTLSAIYIGLLTGQTEAGGSAEPLLPSQIVAVTFTEKAASELRERLARELARRRRSDDLPAAMRVHLAQCWEELPAAPVSTIHSFCSRLLRQAGSRRGVPPGFQTLKGDEAREVFETAMLDEAAAQLTAKEPVFTGLVREWGAKAQMGLVAVCRALTHELRWRGLLPEELARPDDAAGALLALQLKLPVLLDRLRAIAPRIKSDKRERLVRSLESADGEFDCTSGRRVVLSCFADVTGSSDLYKPAQGEESLLREVLGLCHAPQRRALAAFLLSALTRYRREKQRLGALDFDDLLFEARDLLREQPGLGRRYRFVLIDEFQDTDPLQKDILYRIAFPETEGKPVEDPPRLVVVGDRKQSIYRFRGADVSLIQRAADELPMRALQKNFRSRRVLIEWINAFCSQTLWPGGTDGYTADDQMVAGGASARHAWKGPPCELLIQPPEVDADKAADRRWVQAQAIARRIRSLVEPAAEGELVRPQVWDRERGVLRANVRYGDIAILARSLRSLRASLELALGRYRVPFQMLGGVSFFTRPEVLDTINLLAWIADPTDQAARVGVLRSPFALLSDGALFRLSLEEGGEGIQGADAEALSRVDAMIAFLRTRLGLWTAAEMMDHAYQTTGFLSVLAMQPQGEVGIAAARRLIEWTREFETRGNATLSDLVRRLRAEADAEWDDPGREGRPDLSSDLPMQTDAVRIGTVHSAKGLEFPIVILPELGFYRGVGSGRANFMPENRLGLRLGWSSEGLPSQKDDAWVRNDETVKQADEAESRRLLYVALTRASDYLVLSGERTRRTKSAWRDWLDADDLKARETQRVTFVRVPYNHPELVSARPAAEVGAWRFTAGRLAIDPPAGPQPAAALAERVCALLQAGPARPLPPVAREQMECSVTRFVRFLSCPRRYVLEEAHPVAPVVPLTDADDTPDESVAERADVRALGSAAHAVLEGVFCDGGVRHAAALWRQALAANEIEESAPEAVTAWTHLQRALAGKWARQVLALPPERRFVERPFRWRIECPEGTLTLIGALDLLIDLGEGDWRVVDYKLSTETFPSGEAALSPATEALHRYGWQVGLYALAAAHALKVDAGRVRPELLLLAQADEPLSLDALGIVPRAPSVLPSKVPVELASAFLRATRDAARSGNAAWLREQDPAAFRQACFSHDGTMTERKVERCRAEGCPFVARCFGE